MLLSYVNDIIDVYIESVYLICHEKLKKNVTSLHYKNIRPELYKTNSYICISPVT